jgi:two-component system, chemotaxis family, protein-glutamate methylesterase/glutaminase
MINVLIVDDSVVARTVLKDIFHPVSDITVIGEAVNGREAVEKTRLLMPDLVIMDLLMPVMDGIAAIEEIMATCAVPILVLSSTLEDREVDSAFIAIKKGALDVMGKPGGTGFARTGEFEARLVDKVRLLSRIKVIHHPISRPVADVGKKLREGRPPGRTILAIGASTGGPRAVMNIIRALPADFIGTVFVVQHIAPGFARGFAKWLDTECSMRVRVAEDGDEIRGGEALVAPTDVHLILENGRVRLVDSPPVNSCRPSIDVFFNSVAEAEGERVVGILLTGMGKDGATGLLKIKEKGGLTIAQNEESSVVFGMPKAAISLGAAERVLPLAGIPEAVMAAFHNEAGVLPA